MPANNIQYVCESQALSAKVDWGRGRSASNVDPATYTTPICSSPVSSVPSRSKSVRRIVQGWHVLITGKIIKNGMDEHGYGTAVRG